MATPINHWRNIIDGRTATANAGTLRDERFSDHQDWELEEVEQRGAIEPAAPAGVTITGTGGGWFELSGPGLDTERIRGAAAAEARAAELVTPYDNDDDQDDDEAGDGETGEED